MKKLLITGFEPFGGAETNPSWEALRLLPEAIGGHAVHTLCLPVTYQESGDLLMEEIDRLNPTLVVCCGVAAGRTAVTPELAAINYRYARIPDNAGVSHQGDPIDPDGPAAFMTRLPVHAMVSAIQAEDIPAALSLSAGAYVCNNVYYALLSCESDYGHQGLFVHVPGTEAVSTPLAARALTRCIETALHG
jgi:pyroglutamyl-peptidase